MGGEQVNGPQRTDFLGNPYGIDDLIIYPAGKSSHRMILARVMRFTEAGNVTVRPLTDSRGGTWHGKQISFIDLRTGKRINPDSGGGEHIKVRSHWIDTRTGLKIDPYWDTAYGYRRWVPETFQAWVRRVEGLPSPVTLKATENIVKVRGGGIMRKVYRTTRYDQRGNMRWRRLSYSAGQYAATVGDLASGEYARLDVAEVDESAFQRRTDTLAV